jgi:hypothetical protein
LDVAEATTGADEPQPGDEFFKPAGLSGSAQGSGGTTKYSPEVQSMSTRFTDGDLQKLGFATRDDFEEFLSYATQSVSDKNKMFTEIETKFRDILKTPGDTKSTAQYLKGYYEYKNDVLANANLTATEKLAKFQEYQHRNLSVVRPQAEILRELAVCSQNLSEINVWDIKKLVMELAVSSGAYDSNDLKNLFYNFDAMALLAIENFANGKPDEMNAFAEILGSGLDAIKTMTDKMAGTNLLSVSDIENKSPALNKFLATAMLDLVYKLGSDLTPENKKLVNTLVNTYPALQTYKGNWQFFWIYTTSIRATRRF